MKEYKAILYKEGLLGSIFLGGSKINPERMTDFINLHAKEGWEVVTMEKDIRRTLIFFKREAYVIIMQKAA